MVKKFTKWIAQNIALSFTLFFAAITLILWLGSMGKINFSDLWLNLFAGFVASICTIAVIDSALKKQKEKEDLPLKLALYRDVQLFTSRVISLWQEMYVQCNTNRKNILIDDLFSKQEIEAIYENLDLEGSPDVIPQQNWFTFIDNEVNSFIQQGNDIINRYVSFAEPELLQALHHLVNDSSLVAYLVLVKKIRSADVNENIPRPPVLKCYTIMPTERDYCSIKIIFKWCRNNYENLKDEGFVYELANAISIINKNVPPSSVMSAEQLQQSVNEYEQWQKKLMESRNKV